MTDHKKRKPYLRDGFLLCGDDERVARWVNAEINDTEGQEADGTDYHAVGVVKEDGELIAGVVFQSMRKIFPVHPFDDGLEIRDDGYWLDSQGVWRPPVMDVELSVACNDYRAARPRNFRAFFEYAFLICGYGHLTAECDDRNNRAIRGLLGLGFRRIGEKRKPSWAVKSSDGEANNVYGLLPEWISAMVMSPKDVERMMNKMTGSKSKSAPVQTDNQSATATDDLATRNARRAAEQDRMKSAGQAATDQQQTGALGDTAPSGQTTTGAGSIG